MGEGPCKVGKKMRLKVELLESQVTSMTSVGEGIALHKPKIPQDTKKTPVMSSKKPWGPNRGILSFSGSKFV